LVIHQHALAPETTQNVIFVHGLNGQRYSTWGRFPDFFFEDHPTIDVALYDYASGIRRLRRRSVNLSDQAILLAEAIREGDYTQTVLVGHSMGGLLCMAAVQKMIDSQLCAKDGTPTVDRIAGVFLMATPLAGSLRVIPPLGCFSDGRVLRAHSNFTREINSCFTNKLIINCSTRASTDDRHCIRTYAVIGLRDKVVDRYSSGVSIPANQMKHVPRTHRGVNKPSGREDDVYNWVRLRVGDCFNHFTQCPGKAGRPAPLEAGNQGEMIEIPADAYDRVMKSLPDDLKFIIKRQDWGA
jgi:hypothetical protein